MGNNLLKYFSMEYVELPGMSVDPNTVLIAGYSCGSALASNLQIIGSDTIKGSALFNGFYMYGGYAEDADTNTDAKVQAKVDFINT